MKLARIVSVIAILVLSLSLATPAFAQGGEKPSLVAFGSDLVVRGGEVIAGDVMAFGGNIRIEPQGRVTGAVVAFGGNVESSGEVGQSIIALGGNIALRAGSLVRQDVVAVGGEINQSEGARVDGNVSKGFVFSADGRQPAPGVIPPITIPPSVRVAGSDSLLVSIILGVLRAVLTVIVLTAIAVVLVAVFPKPVDGVRETIVAQPASSAGIGCLAQLAAAALTVPLIITCVGPFILWAAIAIASVFGIAAMGLWLGERLLAAAGGRRNPLAAAAFGTALLVLLLTIMDAVPVFSCFGWVFWLVVSAMALGAVILSKFGTQKPGTGATWLTSGTPAATAGPMPSPEAQSEAGPDAASAGFADAGAADGAGIAYDNREDESAES